jgi:hypothetical protein
MIQSSVEPYEALTSAPDDKTRAKLIAEAFERLDERCPHLKDVATRAHLRETELRLVKEIEQVRADLRVGIEQVRGDIARTKLDLPKWLLPLMLAQVAAIAALVKLL